MIANILYNYPLVGEDKVRVFFRTAGPFDETEVNVDDTQQLYQVMMYDENAKFFGTDKWMGFAELLSYQEDIPLKSEIIIHKKPALYQNTEITLTMPIYVQQHAPLHNQEYTHTKTF